MTNKRINIAIDGYSSCGKGTLAKALAQELGYLFIDSGAMYRAVAYATIEHHIHVSDNLEIIKLLPNLNITFDYNKESNYYNTFLNGVNIEYAIRTMPVSNIVSPISKIDEVRTFLVAQQQTIAQNKGVVMDGRDIGTVVLPTAELKIFMTANAEIRAQRRYNELLEKGTNNITLNEVLENLNTRDQQDSTRANSPLKPAPDAIIIDNSNLTKQEQFEMVLGMVRERLS
jgi:CMP/dCMP kinase